MINLNAKLEPTHDLNAEINGFMETVQLNLYEKKDTIPTLMGEWIEPPLLMIEVIDDRPTNLFDSTDGREIVLMKPLKAISITKEQLQFFKKFEEMTK